MIFLVIYFILCIDCTRCRKTRRGSRWYFVYHKTTMKRSFPNCLQVILFLRLGRVEILIVWIWLFDTGTKLSFKLTFISSISSILNFSWKHKSLVFLKYPLDIGFSNYSSIQDSQLCLPKVIPFILIHIPSAMQNNFSIGDFF